MRRVLLMVMAIAAFMSLGTTGALAGTTSGKSKGCKYGKTKDGKCKPKPKPRPKPPECQYGKDDQGKCKPPPIVVPPPVTGTCSKADLVLLEDLLEGTGALLCLYLGDNAPFADDDKDCPDALLALPIDELIGACLFLPPVDVGEDDVARGTSAALLSGLTEATEGKGLTGAAGGTGLKELVSTITGLFKLG